MTLLRQGFGGQGGVLRSIAILIAIAGLIDPAFTISRPASQKLVAVRLTSSPPTEVEQSMRAHLPGWEIEFRDSQSRLACGPTENCVVIADGSVDAIVPTDLSKPLSLIELRSDESPNVTLRSALVSGAHQNGAGVARVQLSGKGIEKSRMLVRVLDAGAVIGSVTHDWSGAPDATLDIPWWPIASGARTLRIEAVPLEGERMIIDNAIDVGVQVSAERAPVLVFDARPSWSSTFVRRAIEDDARFTVGHRTRLAPALSAGTANGRLDAAALDLASVVIIGGPDALTASEVTLLEQFVRVRGGTLILLPERAPAGPWSRLLAEAWTEHLTAKPEAVGRLQATEVLSTNQLTAAASVIARSGSVASIVVTPSGDGRVVVAGAMDAWRYRDLDAGSFDTFWRSLVAQGASWGQATQVLFDADLAVRGSRARFMLRDRRMSPIASATASATARCGDTGAMPVRLWPGGAIGEFTGELAVANGRCTLDATVNDRIVSAAIAVADTPLSGIDRTLAKLESRVKASGGVVIRAGEEATLAKALVAATTTAPVSTTVHPMRAAWWMLPFAAGLSLEWWMRRRAGLR